MPGSSKATKYRPVLTAAQIQHIILLCKNDLSTLSIELIGVLAPFAAKIANAAIAPAYTTTAKPSIISELGFSTEPIIKDSDEIIAEWYAKQQVEGNANLSLTQLEAIQDWRYRNDMMTPEEEATYERSF